MASDCVEVLVRALPPAICCSPACRVCLLVGRLQRQRCSCSSCPCRSARKSQEICKQSAPFPPTLSRPTPSPCPQNNSFTDACTSPALAATPGICLPPPSADGYGGSQPAVSAPPGISPSASAALAWLALITIPVIALGGLAFWMYRRREQRRILRSLAAAHQQEDGGWGGDFSSRGLGDSMDSIHVLMRCLSFSPSWLCLIGRPLHTAGPLHM